MFTKEEKNLNSLSTLQSANTALKTGDFTITAKITKFDEKGLPKAVILKLPESLQREIQMYIAVSTGQSCF